MSPALGHQFPLFEYTHGDRECGQTESREPERQEHTEDHSLGLENIQLPWETGLFPQLPGALGTPTCPEQLREAISAMALLRNTFIL